MNVTNLESELQAFDEACNSVKAFAVEFSQEIITASSNRQDWNIQEVYKKKDELYGFHRRKEGEETEMARERENLVGNSSSINGLKEEVGHVRQNKQEIQKSIESNEERLRKDLAQMSGSEADRRVQDLEAQLSKLGNVLGLNLVRSTHGPLILTFTNIDRSNPDKIFSLQIKVVDRVWKFVESNPTLPNIEELLQTLNETNNISGFVSTVRRSFVKMTKQDA